MVRAYDRTTGTGAAGVASTLAVSGIVSVHVGNNKSILDLRTKRECLNCY